VSISRSLAAILLRTSSIVIFWTSCLQQNQKEVFTSTSIISPSHTGNRLSKLTRFGFDTTSRYFFAVWTSWKPSVSDGLKNIRELDWSTSRSRKDLEGVLRIAVPFGDGFIVRLKWDTFQLTLYVGGFGDSMISKSDGGSSISRTVEKLSRSS